MGDSLYVYHGSNSVFNSNQALPKRQKRYKLNDRDEHELIFAEESFHATLYKHIALAYTYQALPFEIDGKTAHYNMGVSLYENNKKIEILGFNSLEESLEKMYANGGYLYYFNNDKFIHKEGLGNLEVISLNPVVPIKKEFIKKPVEEMMKLGVVFIFKDLSLAENEKYRNYY